MIYNGEKDHKNKKRRTAWTEENRWATNTKEVIANQKQTLNNNTPEERTRNQTSQRNLNEYVILKEKNNRENTNATTQQNSKPNREDEKELNQVEEEGRINRIRN